MPTSIREVAKILNLSITTVSRALDGYTDVSPDTRQRVIQAAQELGYTPNRAARQLRKRTTETIGYLVPAGEPRFSDPFFSEFVAGLGDAASFHNYDLLISTASPSKGAESNSYKRWVQERKVDGFILNRIRVQDWRVQFLHGAGVPFVSLGCSQDNIEYPCIEVDGRRSIRDLVTHLAQNGRCQIGYIGAAPDLVIQVERFAGYQEGLMQAGLASNPKLVIESDLTRQGGYKAALSVLKRDVVPDALVCINDLTAIGALRAAQELGLIVGSQVAITGFDGLEEAASANPSITTLQQPIYEIARELVGMLLNVIHGIPTGETQRLMQPELIWRGSTAL